MLELLALLTLCCGPGPLWLALALRFFLTPERPPGVKGSPTPPR